MEIVDRLLGRKKRTSESISKEIAAQAAALADARRRIEAAKQARENALNALDKAGLKLAGEALADAQNDVALCERAIQVLQVALEEQTQIEAREAFRRDVLEYERQTAEVTARLVNDYPAAAVELAAIVDGLRQARARRNELEARARKFGELLELADPEGFRAGPVGWRIIWPRPEGGVGYGSPESAPRGSIKWVDGEPVANAPGVTVEKRPRDVPESLIEAVGRLPGLRFGDADLHSPPTEVAFGRGGPF